MRRRRRAQLIVQGALALAAFAPIRANAQAVAEPPRACEGDTITAVYVRTHPASSIGSRDELWRPAFPAFASHFATSKPELVRAYLHLDVGQRCTELDRTETERILRSQPFIALASVRTVSDSSGHATLIVDTVDEYPLIVTGGLNHGALASVSLGTQNYRGRGLAVTVSGTRGFAYRDGFGVQATQYGVFNGPNYVAVGGAQTPFGDALSFEFGSPFLTELQRTAFVAGTREMTDYFAVTRPSGDPVSLRTHRASYDIGWVTRLRAWSRKTVAFAGVAVVGEDARVSSDAKIVSDSGFVDIPDDTFPVTYPTFGVARVAAIGGVRALRFITVRGFDALAAEQDVGSGVQVNLLAAPSVWESHGGNDMFVASEAYGGIGDSASFFSVHYTGEARRKAARWDAMVTHARFSWYTRPSEGRTNIASVEASAVRRLDFPAQLSFRDADGGVPGFAGSRAGGGDRAVVRVEQRHALSWFAPRANFAYSLLASAGKLWAGDVPYGTTPAARASVGIALMAALPAGAKHTYRAELAVPINREAGGSRYEIRLTWTDRTRLLWLEPRDVSRLRTGAVPSNLMRW